MFTVCIVSFCRINEYLILSYLILSYLKRYRDILRNSIKGAKMLYYKRTFNLYQNDVKKTWTLIKETLQQNKRQELPIEFIWNDRIITDLDEIANKFNTYFINIGHSMSEQIHATRSSDEYLNNRTNTVLTSQKLVKSALLALLRT